MAKIDARQEELLMQLKDRAVILEKSNVATDSIKKNLSDIVSKMSAMIEKGEALNGAQLAIVKSDKELLDIEERRLRILKQIQDTSKLTGEEFDIILQRCDDIAKYVELYGEGVEEIEGESEEIQKLVKKISDDKNLRGLLLSLNNANKSLGEINSKLEEQTKQYSKIDSFANKIKTTQYKINGLLQVTKQFLTAITKDWTKFNDTAVKVGRSMGMTASQINNLQVSSMKNTAKLAAMYGLEADALMKFQDKYSKATRRNIILNNENKESIASLRVLAGEEGTFEILEQFDKLGGSIDTASAYAMKQQEIARKMGLNAEQSTSIMAKNMDVMNRYSFKRGVNGFQQMVALSQKLKFNMDSVSGALDKASTWEGSIDMASRMQMLGGSYAANFANPGQIMYEALNDAEAFTERIVNTISGKGNFDKNTGKVEINPVDKAFMREMANVTGVSYDTLLNMANRSGVGNAAKKEMNSSLNKTQKEALANMSQWNVERGRFEVTYLDKRGRDVTKAVAEIRPEDMKEIQDGIITEDLEQNVANIYKELKSEFRKRAKDSVSFQERLMGYSSEISATKGLAEQPLMHGVVSPLTQWSTTNPVHYGISGAAALGSLVSAGATLFLGAKGLKAVNKMANNAATGGTGGAGGGGNVIRTTSTAGGVATGVVTPAGKTPNGMFSSGGYVWRETTTRNGTKALERIGSDGKRIAGSKLLTGNAVNAVKNGKNTIRLGNTASTIGKAAKFTKGGVGLGMAAGLVGAGISVFDNKLVENGTIKRGGAADYAMGVGAGALSGAATGAMIGSIIPVIGTGIGAAVGALAGGAISAIKKSNEDKQVKAQELTANNNGAIEGDINLNVNGSIRLIAPSGASTELIKELDKPEVQNKLKKIISYQMAQLNSGSSVNMGSRTMQQTQF